MFSVVRQQSPIELSRDQLQLIRADALVYGAKDTGEMGGGAAAAVLRAAGPKLLVALRERLASCDRRVGSVVCTDSFDLQSTGVKHVLHLISIIKDTPSGAYCPTPALLRGGVTNALRLAANRGADSVALSALGTGEGRVPAEKAASLMIDGVRDYLAEAHSRALRITLALPSLSDFEAFRAVLYRG